MTDLTPAVTIAARPQNGFRRAGLHHPAEAVTHPPGALSAQQLAALLAEPQLLVTVHAPAQEPLMPPGTPPGPPVDAPRVRGR